MTDTQLLGKKTTVVEIPFRFLRTITLGTHKTVSEMQSAITDAGKKISDWGNGIMDQPAFTIAQQEEKLHLVETSVAEIGFPKGTTYKTFRERAVGTEVEFEGETYTVELCPNEPGPQLRTEYDDQPKGEWLRVAMEAITDSGGRLTLFDVGHVGGAVWLSGRSGRGDDDWGGEDRFMFCLRKKAL